MAVVGYNATLRDSHDTLERTNSYNCHWHTGTLDTGRYTPVHLNTGRYTLVHPDVRRYSPVHADTIAYVGSSPCEYTNPTCLASYHILVHLLSLSTLWWSPLAPMPRYDIATI
ncbi:hypothetical protein PVAP13_J684004 [Panicum virgatum]|nr:hypothetical protein PVAP13_J684004 [Panicum virgatum]